MHDKSEAEELAIEHKHPEDVAKLTDKKPTILMVEDNDDFRFYIKDNLKALILTSLKPKMEKKDGKKALAQHPNLIVSDISMPEMTGTELCLKLKNDKRTSHIPAVLLTALAGEDQQLKGLENRRFRLFNKAV